MTAPRDPVAVAFGRVLRNVRREGRLSREDVVKAGGFKRTYPALVERGLYSPTITEVFALAKAIDADPAELIRRTVFALQFVPS